MSMSDPIADMLTRIRNAYKAGHQKVMIPASKIKSGIADVLRTEGYIKDFKEVEKDNLPFIEMELKFNKHGKTIIHQIRRMSKPSRRIYLRCDEIRKYKGGLGISILSTSRGVMSDRNAKKENVGGELICTIW